MKVIPAEDENEESWDSNKFEKIYVTTWHEIAVFSYGPETRRIYSSKQTGIEPHP